MTSQPRIDVAVVVVTYNSAHVLGGLVESLGPGLGSLTWELVIVDNASTDSTVETAQRLAPQARVVDMGHNAGYAAGINAGVAVAPHHRAVLVLNPDVRLEPGCVPALIDILGVSGVGVTVPRLHDAQGRLIDSMRREPTVLRALGDALIGARRAGRHAALGEVVTDPLLYDNERTTAWAEGSTQLVSAECWRACGDWDETFFLYSEEADYHLRARDAGFSTRYVPAARATHLEGGSGSSPGLWALLVVNRVRLYRRRHRAPASAAFWAVTALREGSRAMLGRSHNRAAFRALLSRRLMRAGAGPEWVAAATTRQRRSSLSPSLNLPSAGRHATIDLPAANRVGGDPSPL